MPAVNPDILTWARETAGLSLEDAAKALSLNDTKKASGAARLKALEDGEDEPSRVILRRMAEKYRRPVIAFYLNKRPASGERGEDFRRAADAPPIDFDPKLDALIRNVRARHGLAKDILKEDEDAQPLQFVGSFAVGTSVRSVADSIAETIGFDLDVFRAARDVGAAFTYLRARLERVGIFVMLLGDLGSHHSKIESTMFRGYAIADPIAPFIVINDNDARAAWSFTALHETAHVWLGQSGVSGASHSARIERFCNDVAGELLLPRRELAQFAYLAPLDMAAQVVAISLIAKERNLSRRMIAYQLLSDDVIDGARYQQLSGRFHSDWLRSKARDPDAPKDGRGPSLNVVRRHRLGPAMVGLAQRAVDSGSLSPTKAARMLGVKPTSVHALLHPKPA